MLAATFLFYLNFKRKHSPVICLWGSWGTEGESVVDSTQLLQFWWWNGEKFLNWSGPPLILHVCEKYFSPLSSQCCCFQLLLNFMDHNVRSHLRRIPVFHLIQSEDFCTCLFLVYFIIFFLPYFKNSLIHYKHSNLFLS